MLFKAISWGSWLGSGEELPIPGSRGKGVCGCVWVWLVWLHQRVFSPRWKSTLLFFLRDLDSPMGCLPSRFFLFPCSSWEQGSILALSSICHVLHEASDSTGLFLDFCLTCVQLT